MGELWVVGRRLWWTCDGKSLPCVVRRVFRPASKNVSCDMLMPHGVWERRSLDKASLTPRYEDPLGGPKVSLPPA